MYRFIRTATVRHAGSVPQAMQLAAEVTNYLNKEYSLNMKFGLAMFGTPCVHWHFETDSLDKMRLLNEKLLQDREYMGLVQKYADAWVDGSMKDTIVAIAG